MQVTELDLATKQLAEANGILVREQPGPAPQRFHAHNATRMMGAAAESPAAAVKDLVEFMGKTPLR